MTDFLIDYDSSRSCCSCSLQHVSITFIETSVIVSTCILVGRMPKKKEKDATDSQQARSRLPVNGYQRMRHGLKTGLGLDNGNRVCS